MDKGVEQLDEDQVKIRRGSQDIISRSRGGGEGEEREEGDGTETSMDFFLRPG